MDVEMDDDNREDRENENENHRKESHREIEKQRRRRLKAAMMELARVLPGVSGLKKEPDKLTILKMASSHLRSLPGDERSKEAQEFLFNEQILAEAGDGFQLVMGSNGHILYVSESIRRVLLQDPQEWVGQNIVEQLHPDDIVTFNEQLIGHHLDHGREKERILDLKTGTVKREKSGSQNVNSKPQQQQQQQSSSLLKCICRFKIGSADTDFYANDSDSEIGVDIDVPGVKRRRAQIRANSLGHSFDGQSYAVIHLSGHIRNLCINNLICLPSSPHQHQPPQHSNCFVLTGRRQIIAESPPVLNPKFSNEFMTRQSSDGILTFVDENVRRILGFEPSEILGRNFLQFFPHPTDRWRVTEFFQQVSTMSESPSPEKSPWITFQCQCRKRGEYSNSYPNSTTNYVILKTTVFPFFNPKSAEFEFLLCTNNLIGQVEPEVEIEEDAPIKNFSLESIQKQKQGEKINNQYPCACPNYTAVSPASSTSCYSNLSSPPEFGTVLRWEWENEQQELLKNCSVHTEL